jgi:DNA-binding PadR family transcriptional regulator
MPERNPPPLTPAGFQVLLAIAAGHTHGYAMMRFVEELSDGAAQLGPGTLYRTIARLVADELVEEVAGGDVSSPHDARRRTYRLTRLGRISAERETELLAALVESAASAGLLDRRRGQSSA